MPKVYYCNKSIDGETCGETNQDNFETGRYSTCKKCRNKMNIEYHKSKKEEDKDNKNSMIDPDFSIRSLIEDTINKTPFINGISIKQKFNEVDDNNTETLIACSNKIDFLLDKIEKMEKHIRKLEDRLENKI
jgi:hypothetical protein